MNIAKKIAYISSTIVFVLVCSVICYLYLTWPVKYSIVMEAGNPVPTAGAFIRKDGLKGEYVTDIAAIDTKVVGRNKVAITVNGKKTYNSTLIVKDTIPPQATATEPYIFLGNALVAEDLITDIIDATYVICSFASPPVLDTAGWQNATIVLTDGDKNKTRIETRFLILETLDEVTVEAGSLKSSFSPTDFLKTPSIDKPNGTVTLTLSIQDDSFGAGFAAERLSLFIPQAAASLSHVGSFDVTVSSGNFLGHSKLTVVDTVPPKANAATPYIFAGNMLQASDLVSDIVDATSVVCSFAAPPDVNTPGLHETTVILTDEGGNQTQIKSRYYVYKINVDGLIIEAGSEPVLFSPEQFIENFVDTNDVAIYVPEQARDFMTAGKFPMILQSGRFTETVTLSVEVTVPPTASTRNRRAYLGKPIPASDFVYDIKHFSAVAVSYGESPDFSNVGQQTVTLLLDDEYGNQTVLTAVLNVVHDTEPPRISGQLNKEVAMNGTVSYRIGIIVTDNYDPNPRLDIDSSKVNLREPGVYTVTYTATDECGNVSTASGTITVQNIDANYVNKLADEILSQILTPGMSEKEKARAIFYYVDKKVSYNAGNSPREISLGAHACFVKGSGDCYVYMSGSQVLLTRAGIPNKIIRRVNGASSEHYWNLIDVGEGWHHFDACNNRSLSAAERFYFTESKAREYTKLIGGNRKFYEYDKSTVPEVVE